jgi:hypothetical protein
MEKTSSVGVEVTDLDPTALLSELAGAEVADRAVQLEKLRLAHQWCVLHPATEDTGTATWGHARIPGLSDCDLSLGGEGTPAVAPFAAEPFGAALGVSTQAAMGLLADALDLRHRLPLLWARVESLAVAPWKARRVAAETRALPREAAGWVDAELAGRVDGFGLPTIERLVAHAAARFAPEEQAAEEQTGKDGWHVTLTHPAPGAYAGTSWLEAAGPTADLTAFHALVRAEAQALGRLGDTDTLGQRQAKALGVIAARQATLDLTTSTAPVPRPPTTTTLYLHLSAADLATSLSGADPVVGEVEKLGPATAELIRTWLADTNAVIRPVLDLARDRAVDAHDPPHWLREQVIVRDRHCVFPWCGRDARGCDLDHITPYDPPEQGGPPGQTRPSNLAPLCRRHHRAKTFGGWSYRRQRDGTYTWTSPHGTTYTVGPDGTSATGPPPQPRGFETVATRPPQAAGVAAPQQPAGTRPAHVLTG